MCNVFYFRFSCLHIIVARFENFSNLQEARALLGRLEFQKGNLEAALHVFEGIDIAAVTPKIKLSIARRCELPRRLSQSDPGPPMSMHAVSLLIEAIFMKAKSLLALRRFTGTPSSFICVKYPTFLSVHSIPSEDFDHYVYAYL